MIPIMKITPEMMALKDVPIITCVDGKEFFRNGEIVFGKNSELRKIIVNPGLCFSKFSKDNSTGSINLKKDCTFQQMIENLKFVKEVNAGKEISIGGIATGTATFSQPYESLDNDITFYEQIQCLLEYLHITKPLTVAEFSDQQLYELSIMYGYIIKEIPYETGEEGFCRWECGSLKLFFIISKGRIYDAFHVDQKGWEMSFPGEHERFSSSLYIFLTVEDYESLDNIDYDVVDRCMTSVPYTEKYGMAGVNALLRMLKAYDAVKEPRLLKLSKKFSAYLLENENNIINLINRMQVIRRQRSFAMEERCEIINRREQLSSQNDVLFRAGIASLLGNRDELPVYKSQMTPKQLEEYESNPINILI